MSAVALNLGWVMFAVVGLVWIIAATTRNILRTQARERSRREIYAYVAEGTISVEDAQRLLKAGQQWGSCAGVLDGLDALDDLEIDVDVNDDGRSSVGVRRPKPARAQTPNA
ncbi:MAG: hypothetical protein EA379_04540 [Phycisphaerales bacterium]|nr:MAG: hypothetical protein EA379_04540 [Phycisphaerales bacterium]